MDLLAWAAGIVTAAAAGLFGVSWLASKVRPRLVERWPPVTEKDRRIDEARTNLLKGMTSLFKWTALVSGAAMCVLVAIVALR